MPPFLQFRLWLRRAPGAERALAGAVGAVLVALLAWALVPGGGPPGAGGSSGTVVSGAAGPAPAGGGAAGGASPAGRGARSGTGGPGGGAGAGAGSSLQAAGSGSGAGGPGGAAAPGAGAAQAGAGGGGAPAASPVAAAGSRCSDLRATDQGVTATQIHIGVVLVDFEGQMGDTLFGFPPPAEQQGYYQAVIDSINRAGGIQCRKLVASYYSGNPLDSSEEHAACLQMAQDGLFAAVSIGFYQPPAEDCPSENRIPTVLSTPLAPPEFDAYYPYLFTVNSNWQQLIHNYVMAANQLGWLKGAAKIGLLEVDCQPSLNTDMVAELARIGIPRSRLVTYDYGCYVGIPPPQDVEQAVLEFKTQGVTHVIDDNSISLNQFSRTAQQQDYHPHYSFPDGAAILAYDSQGLAPDPVNFDGAEAVTSAQWGALQTPGATVSPATRTCDQIMAGAHLPSAEQSGDAASGIACDGLWTLQAAMNHDPGLTRAALAAGLDQAGRIDYSYPQGPADFSGSHVVTGGQFWRPTVYVGSCACFRLTNPSYQPSYP